MKTVVLAYRVDDSELSDTPIESFIGCTTARDITRYFDNISCPSPAFMLACCEAVFVADYGTDFAIVSGGVCDGENA